MTISSLKLGFQDVFNASHHEIDDRLRCVDDAVCVRYVLGEPLKELLVKRIEGFQVLFLGEVLNREISSIRIRVEHAIGGIKRYRIVKDKLRNSKKGFSDLVMETCCGLHNFRLNFRPWSYQIPCE